MSAMLATIDDDTARKVDADRLIHGTGCLLIRADGTAVHVPIARVQILAGPAPADADAAFAALRRDREAERAANPAKFHGEDM